MKKTVTLPASLVKDIAAAFNAIPNHRNVAGYKSSYDIASELGRAMNKKEKPLTLADVGMVWNDPSPIEGNDYTVRSIDIPYCEDEDAVITITYGEEGSDHSEAEVSAHEIIINRK